MIIQELFTADQKILLFRRNDAYHELSDKELQKRLVMLVKMLRQIGNTRLESTLSTYGLQGDIDGDYSFNSEVFQRYKNGTLAKRVQERGYVFFELLNQEGKIIGIASGEEKSHLNPESQFRFLNLYVDESYQKQGYGKIFMYKIFEELSSKFDHVTTPISNEAQKQGKLELYERLLTERGITYTKDTNDVQYVLTFGLQKFKPSPETSSPRVANNNQIEQPNQ